MLFLRFRTPRSLLSSSAELLIARLFLCLGPRWPSIFRSKKLHSIWAWMHICSPHADAKNNHEQKLLFDISALTSQACPAIQERANGSENPIDAGIALRLIRAWYFCFVCLTSCGFALPHQRYLSRQHAIRFDAQSLLRVMQTNFIYLVAMVFEHVSHCFV